MSRLPRRSRGMTISEIIAFEVRRGQRIGGCIVAVLKPNSQGYVVIPGHGRLHRLVLEKKLGRSLGRQEEACHSCHRRNCINDRHLYAGSHADNMADMVRSGRGKSGQRQGAENSVAKLTVAQVTQIRRLYEGGGISQAALARDFGVSDATVCRVVNRRTYR